MAISQKKALAEKIARAFPNTKAKIV